MSNTVNCSNCSFPECKVRGSSVAATDCPEIKKELMLKKLDFAFDREPLIDSVNSIRVQDYNRLRKTKIGSKYEEFNQYMRSEGFEEVMNTFNSFQKDLMSLYMKVYTGYSKGPSKLSTQVSSVVVFYNTNKEVLKYIEFKNGETNYKL